MARRVVMRKTAAAVPSTAEAELFIEMFGLTRALFDPEHGCCYSTNCFSKDGLISVARLATKGPNPTPPLVEGYALSWHCHHVLLCSTYSNSRFVSYQVVKRLATKRIFTGGMPPLGVELPERACRQDGSAHNSLHPCWPLAGWTACVLARWLAGCA